ncbi:unnamed protein product [Urochloa humidicola]
MMWPVPVRIRRARGEVGGPVPVGEGLERHCLADLRRVVDLVVARREDPRLVSQAPLREPAPRVPPVVVVERVLVGVREVADEEHGVPRVLLVVGQRAVGVGRLAQVADQAQPERRVRVGRRRRREPEGAAGRVVAAQAHGVVVLGGVVQARERAVVDEAGGVVVEGVAGGGALGGAVQLVGGEAVEDGAVALSVGGDPGHGHGRAGLVAQRDVHLLRGVPPRWNGEHVSVQRHILRRLVLPPERARHPAARPLRRLHAGNDGDDEQRHQRSSGAMASLAAFHCFFSLLAQLTRSPVACYCTADAGFK